MVVRVNGAERDVAEGATVSDLVASLGYRDRTVVVELNGEALERELYPRTALRAGDSVEVVRAVAGG